MPTYEYECETCGIHFERWQRITDEALKQCPECDGPVHRVLHPVGIVFKGSGFYPTDYRSSSYNEAAKKDTSGSAEKSSGHSCGSSCGCSGGAKKEAARRRPRIAEFF